MTSCNHISLEMDHSYRITGLQDYSCDHCGYTVELPIVEVIYHGDYEGKYGLVHLFEHIKPFKCEGCNMPKLYLNLHCNGISISALVVKEKVIDTV